MVHRAPDAPVVRWLRRNLNPVRPPGRGAGGEEATGAAAKTKPAAKPKPVAKAKARPSRRRKSPRPSKSETQTSLKKSAKKGAVAQITGS